MEENSNIDRLQKNQGAKDIKSDQIMMDDKILLNSFDFVNYLELDLPEKESREKENLFPLKMYESEKKTKFILSELNPQNELASQIYKEEKNFIFSMAFDDKIIFSDYLGNIKFYSFKKKKISKTLQYPLKNTPEKYKSYAMDIINQEKIYIVGYENGQIAVFKKTKCEQIIGTGKNYNIINIKIMNHTKKQIQFLYSDIKGNINMVNLKSKSLGGFEERIDTIIQSNEKAPFYLIYLLKFKDKEISANKSLKDLNDVFVFVNKENIFLYTYSDTFKNIDNFKKPEYIKDDSLPDVAIGLGKQPSNDEPSKEDEDLSLLYFISWGKVIYLNVLCIKNKNLEISKGIGHYVNEAPIVRIGFLNLSTVYLIDKEGNFKLLNTRKFNQGSVNIDEKLTLSIIPEDNNNIELQNVFKMNLIKSHSYLTNEKLKTYIYSIINNRNKYEFFAFGENTIYQQSLINYQKYMENLYKKGEWLDLFLLGKDIYKGKLNALDGIPMKIGERKEKVKEYLQELIKKYLNS